MLRETVVQGPDWGFLVVQNVDGNWSRDSGVPLACPLRKLVFYGKIRLEAIIYLRLLLDKVVYFYLALNDT